MTKFQCSNCGHVGDVADLRELDDDAIEQLQGGTGRFPDGICPECDTLCDADPTPEERKAQLVRDAAPDMLAALKLAITRIPGDDMTYSEGDHGARVYTRDVIAAAIAKAEGETLEALSEEWECWCRAEGLECVEAEEMLLLVKLTPAQTAFVTEFCERWRRVERKRPSGV